MKKNDNIEIDNANLDDTYTRLISLMDTVTHTDVEQEAEDSEELIYGMILDKIDSGKDFNKNRLVKNKRILSFLQITAGLLLLAVSSSIFYYLGEHNGSKIVTTDSWISVSSPRGTRSNITLPDGTEVTLNGGAKMEYLASFTNARNVKLDGEAYFDVAHNKKIPFNILTENIDVVVLGTKLNLKAYKGDEVTALTLLEGSVAGKTKTGSNDEEIVRLVPNQQLVLNNATKEFAKYNVDAAEFAQWIDGILRFKDVSLPQILLTLERQYNVEIELKTTDKITDKYYGRFENNETIDQILNLLSYKRNWTYLKQDNRYLIFNK